ncbi:hypothetical protein CY35_05G053700 [Sphagnum magellanicum]|nr:hypothetical protein CY35_05G053700 [Sphagnum magellanicum]
MVGRRSMTADVDGDAQRLRSLILQCSSRDIVAACQAVEAQLQTVGGEHVRDFYRLCFPILLRKIFGFEDSHVAAAAVASSPLSSSQQGSSPAGGWLAQSSLPGNEAAAKALISLLSPRGSLFSSLLAADKETFVRYVFPTERLPAWVRRLLSMDKGVHMLRQFSALFKNRIIEDATGSMQVHLDVFEYYMFWFAYYAVCKDPNSSQGAVASRRSRSTASRSAQLRTQIESWASSIPRLHHSPQAIGAGGNPYLQLLKLYLSHFVAFGNTGKALPGSSDVGSVYRKPIESPIGLFGSPMSSPPGSSMLPSPTNPYSQTLQRPLYRFLLRAFQLWPIGTPIRKLLEVVEVWLDYLEPWNVGLDATNARHLAQWHWLKDSDHVRTGESLNAGSLSRNVFQKQGEGTNGHRAPGLRTSDHGLATDVYTDQWQGYVLANYLFYTSLVTHFLEAVLKFVHIDPEAVLQMTYKVLNVLARSKELVDLLRKVELAYATHFYGCPTHSSNVLLDLAPILQEQLQDWEEGAGMNEEQEHGDGILFRSLSFHRKPPQLHLFSMSDNGGNRLLQALFMRAEVEMQSSSSEKLLVGAQGLEAVKDTARKIFNFQPIEQPSGTSPGFSQSSPQGNLYSDPHNGALSSRPSGLKRHSWQDVRYRGDWMRRPIESTEVAFLARLFVRLSDSINNTLGLTVPLDIVKVDEGPSARIQTESGLLQPPEVKVPSSSNGQGEIKLSDILLLAKGVLWQVVSILQLEARNRGWRINLRGMAEKKFLVNLTLVLLVYWVVHSIVSFISSYTNS